MRVRNRNPGREVRWICTVGYVPGAPQLEDGAGKKPSEHKGAQMVPQATRFKSAPISKKSNAVS